MNFTKINLSNLGLPNNNVVPQLKSKVMDFKQMMPCIASLRNPSLKPRHWFEIESLLEKSIVNNSKLTLGNLRDMNVSATCCLSLSVSVSPSLCLYLPLSVCLSLSFSQADCLSVCLSLSSS